MLHRIISVIAFILVISLTTGCKSNKNGNETLSIDNDADSLYYRVRDTVLPNPDLDIQKIQRDRNESFDQIWERKILLQENIVYRWVRVEGDVLHNYLQICREPYQEWESFIVDDIIFNALYPDKDEIGVYNILDIQVTDKQEVFFLCMKITGDRQEQKIIYGPNHLIFWSDTAEEVFTNELPDSLDLSDRNGIKKRVNMYQEDILYVYEAYSKYYTKYNLQSKEEQTDTQDGGIWDTIQNPQTAEVYSYGMKDKVFGIWNIANNEAIINLTDLINIYDENNVDLTCTDSEEFFLCDDKTIWKIEDKELSVVSDFLDQGFLVDQLYDMSSKEDTVLILAEVEGDYCLLSATEEERPVFKEEVVLGGYSTLNIQKAVTMFNRRNDEYHITLFTRYDDEDYEDFIRRFQIEVTAEGAIDLLLIDKNEVENYVQNGYLGDISEYIEITDDFWPAALEVAKYDQVQYGIPYSTQFRAATCSKKLVGDRKKWTMQEMMDIIHASDTEILLNTGLTADCITGFAFIDRENNTYIDWNKGISHLTEAPFLELLQFTKKYTMVDCPYSLNELDDLIKTGKVAVDIFSTITPDEMYFIRSKFQNNYSIIGYPTTGDSGIYVDANCIYVYSNTKKENGVSAFLEYLLSENVQLKISTGDFADLPKFPVRLSVMENVFSYYNNSYYWNTPFNKSPKMTDEEVNMFREFMVVAKPYIKDSAITSIIAEEIKAYLYNQKTAEEVAAIMDNRVQLYLNEKYQ